MDNLNPDSKLMDDNKNDSINDMSTIESNRKLEVAKKKVEKQRKDDIRIVGIDSDELVAIGRSTCGRWVKFQKRLGEGGYKTVFKAYDSEKGNNVAWCEFKPHHVDTREKQVNMMHEIEIMVRMDHPNIVTCYDVFDEYVDTHIQNNPVPFKSIILIQELMGEGTLKSVIKKNFINGKLILKFTLIAYWLHQIVSALSYMHEKLNPPIIHRDLKADNCFLESKSSEKYLNVKVGDFGLAKQLGNKEKNTMLGTVGFMAPEVYDEKYDAKVDIYAFGMLMLEVVTNRTPYDDCETVMQVAKETMSGKMPEIFNLVHDQGTREVISACIHPLPSYRPTAMELFYHPIFINKNEDDLRSILPVEITPNFDRCIDREGMVNSFVANIISESREYNTKFNLRMDFRDKRIQRCLNLDDGESLEFDLDIYKEEDIPELISNLKSEFEENMREGLNPNKNIEAKQINIQLEKIFKSMELQMQFLSKMLLGKRWFYILDSILSKQIDIDLKDDVTGFSLLATYKTNWLKASKQLDVEILEYRKFGKSDEMKKISKIFKLPESLKFDSAAMKSTDSTKMEKKSIEIGKRPDGITNMRMPNAEATSPQTQVPAYMYPMPGQPTFYPFNYAPYPNSPQVALQNNPLFFPPMMPPVQNLMDPMIFYKNQETTNQQSKKSQTSPKVTRSSLSQKAPSIEKQEQKEDYEDNVDRIYTFDEVMKYISSKSHRHSKHPFMVIPVAGQSNAFRLTKVTDPKYMELKPVEESMESTVKQSTRNRKKSSKTVNDSVNVQSPMNAQQNPPIPVQNFPMGYPQNFPVPQPTNLNTMGNFGAFQLGYPSNPSPGIMQYWMQQQNYFQQLMMYQQMQSQFSPYISLQKHSAMSQSVDSNMPSIHEEWPEKPSGSEWRFENNSVHESIRDNRNIKVNAPSETPAGKFLVTKIDETDFDDKSESLVSFTVIEKQRKIKGKTKESSKSHQKQENDNRTDKQLKENHFNLELVDMHIKRVLGSPINGHGEQFEFEYLLNPDNMKDIVKIQNKFRSIGCQTSPSPFLVSKSRNANTVGTSTDVHMRAQLKARLRRSSTFDFVDSESTSSTNINSSLYSHMPKFRSATNFKRILLPKTDKE